MAGWARGRVKTKGGVGRAMEVKGSREVGVGRTYEMGVTGKMEWKGWGLGWSECLIVFDR